MYGSAIEFDYIVIRNNAIRLVPNVKQERYFVQACGVARFAYNWALIEWERLYALGEPRSELLLRRKLNAMKREAFPWMLEVTKCAPQQAIKNLGRAYAAYFLNLEKARKGELDWRYVRKPRLKRKGQRDSFRADNGPSPCGGRTNAVKTAGRWIKFPRVGWIRMRESVRFQGQILSAVVTRQADRWYVNLAVRTDDLPLNRTDVGIAGCDLGLGTFAKIFDGEQFHDVPAVRPLRRVLSRMRRFNRSLARKQLGSRNRAKAKAKLARFHLRVKDVRRDVLHKLSTSLVRTHRVIGIEDLNPSGMVRDRFVALSCMDAGFGEFRQQLVYKAAWYGSRVIVADRWFPSSKLCAECQSINSHVRWHVREWTCGNCGMRHDRDENAARNLHFLAASSAATACGAEGAGQRITVDETGRSEAGRLS